MKFMANDERISDLLKMAAALKPKIYSTGHTKSFGVKAYGISHEGKPIKIDGIAEIVSKTEVKHAFEEQDLRPDQNQKN